jgi:hypothetical protein
MKPMRETTVRVIARVDVIRLKGSFSCIRRKMGYLSRDVIPGDANISEHQAAAGYSGYAQRNAR